jgi:hypothetical protein
LLVIADGRIKMKIEVRLHNKWPKALLPALMVLALGACSSSEEASSDTSGETSEGVDCSTQPTDARVAECEMGKEMID